MSNYIKPNTVEEILEVVKWANSKLQSLDILGLGSKTTLGRKIKTQNTLHLKNLSGIVEYQPSELVITAKAATPITKVNKILKKNNQFLAFEPPDFGLLLGHEPNFGSVGGVISCNLAGPRRIKNGSVRDHLLGFEAISGRGEEFKSGGKVVKNVTGFDLSKLVSGAYGTLGILTQISLRSLPLPEKTRTIIIQFSSKNFHLEQAMDSMAEALMSSHEISGAAFLPKTIATESHMNYIKLADCNTGIIRNVAKLTTGMY